jgi:hypothetical protein
MEYLSCVLLLQPLSYLAIIHPSSYYPLKGAEWIMVRDGGVEVSVRGG